MRTRADFSLTEDIERDLNRDTPMHIRSRTIRELSEDVLTNRLDDVLINISIINQSTAFLLYLLQKAIEKLWFSLQDLLQRDQARENRHLTFTFLRCLIQGQYERLGQLRAHFFRVIKQYDHPEDTTDRFELLNTLTFNGKDILYFEEEVSIFSY